MADKNLEAKVTLEADTSGAEQAANAMAGLKDRALDIAAAASKLSKGMESVERSLSGVTAKTKNLSGALSTVTANDASGWSGKVKQEFNELSDSIANATDKYREFRQAQVLGKTSAIDAFKGAGLSKDDLRLMEDAQNAARANPVADSRAQERDMAALREHLRKKTLEVINAEHDLRMSRAQHVAQIKAQTKAKHDAKQASIELAATLQKEAQAQKNAASAKSYSLASGSIDRSPIAPDGTLYAERYKAEGRITAQNTVLARTELAIAAANKKRFDSTGMLITRIDQLAVSQDRLANTRYALHDVSMTMAVGGAALLASVGLAVKASADYEAAMASIQRTGELSVDQAASLRDDIVSIAQEIPASFADIGKVGELAGQLNVEADNIAAFSKSVLMFSATTNTTAEDAATAFGRLDTLLPDVKGNYDALGSSILKVGINSVATESEIISTSSQIAAAGAQAGMTASQVIGLSASFASLGIAPEAARGTVIRVLGLMNTAVAEGGAKLEEFAATAGISAAQFKATWGTPEFAGNFVKFLEGVASEGDSAQLALKDMGIWAARDQNNLLKLSQNADLVAGAFSDAANGFNNSGLLADNFGIKADTLNAKLQKLANSFQALVGTLGEKGIGGLGTLVDMLNSALVAAEDLAKNPVAQWATTVVGAVAAVSGAVLLMGSGVARVTASLLAGRPIIELAKNAWAMYATNLMIATRAANAHNVTMTTTQARAMALTMSFKGLAGAMRMVASGTLIGAGLTAAFSLWEAASKAMMSNTDRAKNAFGDISGLVDAAKRDAANAVETYGSVEKALADTNSGYKLLNPEVDENNARLQEARDAAANAANAQSILGDEASTTTESLRQQGIVMGENTQREMLKMLLGIDGVKQSLSELKAVGFPIEEWSKAIASGDFTGAQAMIDNWTNSAVKSASATAQTREQLEALIAVSSGKGALFTLSEAARAAEGEFGLLSVELEIANSVLGETSGAAGGTGDAFTEMGDEASGAAANISELNSAVADAFNTVTNLSSLSDAFSNIISGLAGIGGTVAEMNAGVLENNKDIQTAIIQSIIAGQAMGLTATESVQQLFNALQAKGVQTATLLASLSGLGIKNVGGVNLKDITTGSAASASSAGKLTGILAGLDKQLKKVGASSGGASGGISNVGNAAREAAQKVYNLTDYAGDLAKIWGRAYDIRFNGISTMDKVVSQFAKMRKEAADAAKKIRDLQNTISGLNADISIKEYFLSVEIEYSGNSERAQALEAELAKQRAELADRTDEMAAAQDSASSTLVGNSNAAIENRANILTLVSGYQAHIKALAEAGVGAAQLQSESARLKAEFLAQAAQLGYNSNELGIYAAAFDDVTYAIQNIPRDITVTANTNPAVQAFNEMKAAADAALASANAANGAGGGGGGGGGFGSGLSGFDIPAESQPKPAANGIPKVLKPEAVIPWIDQQIATGAWSIERAAQELGVSTAQAYALGLGGARQTVSDTLVRATGAAAIGVSDQGARLGDFLGTNFNAKSEGTITSGFGSGALKGMHAGSADIGTAGNTLGLVGSGALVASGAALVSRNFGGEVSSGMNSGSGLIGARGASIGSNAGGAISGAAAGSTRSNFGGAVSSAMSDNQWTISNRASSIGSLIGSAMRTGISLALDNILGRSGPARDTIRAVTGFRTGGYTGPGSASKVAGIVHSGEYVFPKKDVNQSTGTPNVEAMMKFLPRNTAGLGSGGGGISQVALTAGTIQAIAHAVQPYLVIDGKLVGEVSSNAFAKSNAVGAY